MDIQDAVAVRVLWQIHLGEVHGAGGAANVDHLDDGGGHLLVGGTRTFTNRDAKKRQKRQRQSLSLSHRFSGRACSGEIFSSRNQDNPWDHAVKASVAKEAT